MGELVAHLKDVNDLEERVQTIQSFVEVGNEYDRYFESGPSTLANVVTEHSGEINECKSLS